MPLLSEVLERVACEGIYTCPACNSQQDFKTKDWHAFTSHIAAAHPMICKDCRYYEGMNGVAGWLRFIHEKSNDDLLWSDNAVALRAKIHYERCRSCQSWESERVRAILDRME